MSLEDVICDTVKLNCYYPLQNKQRVHHIRLNAFLCDINMLFLLCVCDTNYQL